MLIGLIAIQVHSFNGTPNDSDYVLNLCGHEGADVLVSKIGRSS